MSAQVTPSREQIDRFRAAVAERLGLRFDPDSLDGVSRVLCAHAGNAGVEQYMRRLLAPSGAHEQWRALARELTVGETYFFRNAGQLDVLADVALPSLARQTNGRRRLHILSAGCSSGEEAYSIAILARERCPEVAPLVRIHGIDMNDAAIARAIDARYSAWSLRETPADIRRRYFATQGRELVLDERVRRMVSFDVRNLVEDDIDFWSPCAFDVVFCRNVLMYLSTDVASEVVARIARSVAPGGFLFLGHAETLRGLSADFDLRHTEGAFYYQPRDSPRLPAPSRLMRSDAVTPVSPHVPPAAEAPAAWFGAIQRASERIEALARDRASRPPCPASHAATPRDLGDASGGDADVEAAMDLLRQERFADALARLRGLPAASLDDPGTLLLLAVVLTNSGDSLEAEQICARLVSYDASNAGAHYLKALCRERAGDPDAAIDHDRTAARIDPLFAMPRLHLGLLARKARDFDAARAELQLALSLLPYEDAWRITLFGGGFQRDALIQLCRAQLEALGPSRR